MLALVDNRRSRNGNCMDDNGTPLDLFGEAALSKEEFPTTDTRLSALGFYIENLDEFVSLATNQTHVREKHKIDDLDDPVDQGEREGTLATMMSVGLFNLESLIFGSTMVGVYGAFESTVNQIFNYCALEYSLNTFEKYKKEMNYRKLSFPILASEYSSEILKLPLFCDSLSFQSVDILRRLRNSFVHSGSLISALDVELRNFISNSKIGSKYFSKDELRWHFKKAGLDLFFNQVNSTINTYSANAARKYYSPHFQVKEKS